MRPLDFDDYDLAFDDELDTPVDSGGQEAGGQPSYETLDARRKIERLLEERALKAICDDYPFDQV